MITQFDGLQQLVAFTFILSFFGMTAAALFFILERDRVAPLFRQSVIISALVCSIAALNYFYMRQIYIAGVESGVATFPTEFRYIDWLLTVPLMLVKFPSLLGLGSRGRQIMFVLIGLAATMILTGYIGEVNPDNRAIHLGLFAVGCVAGGIIFALLALAMKELPESLHAETRQTIRWMSMLVLIGWLVYPLGFLAPSLGLDPEVRELVYNVSDLVNKVGLGLIVYFGGRRLLLATAAEEAADEPETVTPVVAPGGAALPRRRSAV